MQDITEAVGRYREAARHLWNTTFCAASPNWDVRDNFSRVAVEMFTAIVLERNHPMKRAAARVRSAELTEEHSDPTPRG
jgi:hypothetical protein